VCFRKAFNAISTTMAAMIRIQRSFGMCAPRTVVVSLSQAGAATVRASFPPDRDDERRRRQAEPDGDEHLLDVALVERPDQHELDESREDPTDHEPASAPSRKRGSTEIPGASTR